MNIKKTLDWLGYRVADKPNCIYAKPFAGSAVLIGISTNEITLICYTESVDEEASVFSSETHNKKDIKNNKALISIINSFERYHFKHSSVESDFGFKSNNFGFDL